MTLLIQIKNGDFRFSSPYHRQMFERMKRENEGKELRVEPDNEDVDQMQKFFSGPVCRYFFYQHERGVFQNFAEVRETLKLEANPKRVYNLKTRRYDTQGGSTQGHSKRWWQNSKETGFLDKVQRMFQQNGYEFPDSEDYKDWLKRAPAADEVYPPLQRLIEIYNKRNETRQ